jgi:hypothetical protein
MTQSEVKSLSWPESMLGCLLNKAFWTEHFSNQFQMKKFLNKLRTHVGLLLFLIFIHLSFNIIMKVIGFVSFYALLNVTQDPFALSWLQAHGLSARGRPDFFILVTST